MNNPGKPGTPASTLFIVVLTTALGACLEDPGGDGAGSRSVRAGSCTGFYGATAISATGSVQNVDFAADGNPHSYASARLHNGALTITAGTTDGGAFQAGNQAGAWISISASNGAVPFKSQPPPIYWTAKATATVNTYYQGVLLESSAAPTTKADGNVRYVHIDTTRPFDAVEVAFEAASTGYEVFFRVFEICSDYGTP